MSCEEFYKSNPDRKFHLVLMIHVMYYIEDYKEVIKIYTDMLYEGGTLLVLLDSYSKCFLNIKIGIDVFFVCKIVRTSHLWFFHSTALCIVK